MTFFFCRGQDDKVNWEQARWLSSAIDNTYADSVDVVFGVQEVGPRPGHLDDVALAGVGGVADEQQDVRILHITEHVTTSSSN